MPLHAPSVEYLGHKISDKGIQPNEVKIRAIVEAPALNSVSQLLHSPTDGDLTDVTYCS